MRRYLLDLLREQPEPLFALVDTAQNDRVLELLRTSGAQYESLYEGRQGEELARVAPYLVALSKTAPLLAALVKEGWGTSWSVYVTSLRSFQEVRKHFRQFLLVQTEEGKQLYFRFYDPRVLRVFLPACTDEESVQFFGPIRQMFVEHEEASKVLRFSSAIRTPETIKIGTATFTATKGSNICGESQR